MCGPCSRPPDLAADPPELEADPPDLAADPPENFVKVSSYFFYTPKCILYIRVDQGRALGGFNSSLPPPP